MLQAGKRVADVLSLNPNQTMYKLMANRCPVALGVVVRGLMLLTQVCHPGLDLTMDPTTAVDGYPTKEVLPCRVRGSTTFHPLTGLRMTHVGLLCLPSWIHTMGKGLHWACKVKTRIGDF